MSVFGALEHAWKAYREGNVHDAELWDNVNLRDTPLLLEEYQDGHIDRAEALRLHSRLVGTQRPDDPDNVRLGLFNMNRGDQQRTMNQLVALPHTQNKLENFRILLKYTTLTTLNLSSSSIGITVLAAALAKQTTITSLILASDHISGEGATALAKALKENTTITTLDLRVNNIGDVGATALAEALKENKTITTLNLVYNKIAHVGATALAGALKENQTITTLNLANNQIGAVGATALAEAIKENKTITTLNLVYNP